MGREVCLGESEFIIKLTGVIWVSAFKRELKIPYSAIENVYIDYFDIPRGMLRTLGTSIPGGLCEGSFLYDGDSYFLSYEHKVPLLHLKIEGYGKYKYVIIEIDNPRDMLIDLRKKIRESAT